MSVILLLKTLRKTVEIVSVAFELPKYIIYGRARQD